MELQRRESSAIITGCYKGIGALYVGIQNAMPYLREELNQFATTATKAANEVAKSFTQVFDCFQLPELEKHPDRNEFLQARMYCCEPLMENAIVQITEPKNTQEEKYGV